MKAVLTRTYLSYEAVRNTRLAELQRALADAGRELANHQARMLFDLINRVTAETGNVVSGKGRPAFEAIMDALGKIQIDFEGDEPKWPTMVMGPGMAERLQKASQEWLSDPEKRRRWNALLQRKRRAYIARERSRKLVE
jgi:hypothetical protein